MAEKEWLRLVLPSTGCLFIWRWLLDGGNTQEVYHVVSDMKKKRFFQVYKRMKF